MAIEAAAAEREGDLSRCAELRCVQGAARAADLSVSMDLVFMDPILLQAAAEGGAARRRASIPHDAGPSVLTTIAGLGKRHGRSSHRRAGAGGRPLLLRRAALHLSLVFDSKSWRVSFNSNTFSCEKGLHKSQRGMACHTSQNPGATRERPLPLRCAAARAPSSSSLLWSPSNLACQSTRSSST